MFANIAIHNISHLVDQYLSIKIKILCLNYIALQQNLHSLPLCASFTILCNNSKTIWTKFHRESGRNLRRVRVVLSSELNLPMQDALAIHARLNNKNSISRSDGRRSTAAKMATVGTIASMNPIDRRSMGRCRRTID